MEQKSIDEILNDEPEETPAEAQETVAEEQPVEVPRDESGRFARKGDDGAPPAQVGEEPVFSKAVLDERRRRQEAEQRAAALEAQIQALQNPPAPPPSVWEDEQGFGGHIVDTAVQTATLNSRVMMSEMLMRQSADDFDAMREVYLNLERENPSLIPQVMNDPHPWNKAYQIAKSHQKMQEVGATDIDSLKAAIRAEIEAEMQQGLPPAGNRPIPTLTNERNVASRTGPAWTGPRSLSDILR